jgi:hypothetical protein
VLLLIRGVVNGLRPETTKTSAATAAAAGTAGTAQLHVVVRRAANAPVDKTRIELRRLPKATPPIKESVTDATGEVEFKGLASGSVWVAAVLDLPGGVPVPLTALQKVELKAGQTESIEITLA